MLVIQVQGKPKVIPIKSADEFDDHNIAGFSYLIKNENDLEKVPTSALVAIYNAMNPASKIIKFSDRDTAVKRTAPLIRHMADGTTPGVRAEESKKEAKPKAEKKVKAPKEPKPKAPKGVKKEKGPGVVSTFKALAMRAAGVTYVEAVKELKDLFPQRAEASMLRTCKINIRPIYSPGMKWTKVKEEGRGWVYRLRKES